MTYLAVFEDKSRGVRRANLIAALERDWPTSVILERQGSQKSRDVVWSYTNDSQELEGYSHVDGTCIYLDSPLLWPLDLHSGTEAWCPPKLTWCSVMTDTVSTGALRRA